jgi:Na+/H+ antiporter NhaD/arsenite permease-like protein
MGLVLTVGLLAVLFRGSLWAKRDPVGEEGDPDGAPPPPIRPLIIKGVVVTCGMMIAFFCGLRPALVALSGGAIMLLTRRVKSERVYAQIDWPLLVMFSGLFIVVAGMEKAVLSPRMIAEVGALHLERLPVLSAVSAVLSNLVSNVPAVLVLKPFVTHLPNAQQAWLALAMSSTLAGNFTLVGSVANLIVARNAQMRGVEIGFLTYFKAGAPLTLLTLILGVWWL